MTPRWTWLNRKPLCRPCLLAACGVAACAGPPKPGPGKLLGYGTPGVESYLPAGEADSLPALLARCRGVPAQGAPQPQTLEAACDQLHRTVRNQPGNALSTD